MVFGPQHIQLELPSSDEDVPVVSDNSQTSSKSMLDSFEQTEQRPFLNDGKGAEDDEDDDNDNDNNNNNTMTMTRVVFLNFSLTEMDVG